MDRSSSPIIVKYFYVFPCVIRFMFSTLQSVFYCLAISLELPFKVMWIGR